jgi:hypothetical protein
MGRKKSRKSRKGKSKKNSSLFGIEMAGANTYIGTAKEGGLILLAAIAAGGAGAALGKHSLLAGVPLTLIGIHRKNNYLIAAGLGLTLSNGFQRPRQTTQGVDGFDLKVMTQEAKDRVGTFFQNFKEKLYLSPATSGSGANGLGEGEEQVTYFMNPYSGAGELDMSAIDRVQEQIAEMNKNVAGMDEREIEGMNEPDREF